MSDTALLIIDIQNDYFPGGKFPLVGIDAAAANAAALVAAARENGLVVVHVRHEEASADADFFGRGTPGADINPAVAPAPDEPVIVKHQVNAFLGTDLDQRLRGSGVTRLVVAGAMSHMCVDAGTRAALDLGYAVTVAHDAVATRDLAFAATTVPAAQVHATMMAALEGAGAGMAATADLARGWRA